MGDGGTCCCCRCGLSLVNPTKKKVTGIEVRRLKWSPDLEQALGVSLGGDRDEIAADVRKGELLALSWNGQLFTVSEIQDHTLVLCCVAGANLQRYLPSIYRWAQGLGCEAVRVHTYRQKVFLRIGRRYGAKLVGESDGMSVIECEVANGRTG